MPTNLAIAVVDDDEAVRRSTASLLRLAGFQTSLFESGDAFLEADLADIGCVLLDIRMPGTDGIGVLKILREEPAPPPVLIMTGHGDVPLAVQAIKLGAQDFLEKPYGAESLISAIERTLAEGRHAGQAAPVDAEAVAVIESLSRRQRQVLCGILSGHLNKVIAYEMGLSIRTVESYRAQLLTRLGVRGTAEAVRVALAAGLDCSDYAVREKKVA
jgi:two-component system response regulator FixJ